MIVGVTGSRDGLTVVQRGLAVLLLDGRYPGWARAHQVHHGDCIGVDAEICRIAHDLHIMTVSHPPIDSKQRAFCISDVTLAVRLYKERNQDIVNMTERLVGFPSGEEQSQLRSGTWQTIRYAKKLHHPVLIIYPDGREEER